MIKISAFLIKQLSWNVIKKVEIIALALLFSKGDRT